MKEINAAAMPIPAITGAVMGLQVQCELQDPSQKPIKTVATSAARIPTKPSPMPIPIRISRDSANPSRIAKNTIRTPMPYSVFAAATHSIIICRQCSAIGHMKLGKHAISAPKTAVEIPVTARLINIYPSPNKIYRFAMVQSIRGGCKLCVQVKFFKSMPI